MEFRRQLSADALEYLRNEGSFIIPEIKAARNGDPFSLDIQIRKDDEIMVYMGNSCILTIKLRTQTGQIVFEAHQTYYDPFLGTYLVSNVPSGAISKYLELTIPKVNGNFYRNQKEGYYQNILCYKQGENSSTLSPFIIFDRECVPGFGDIQERFDIFNPIVKKKPRY